MVHCEKSFRMRIFSGPYSIRMRENADRKNSEYRHFSPSGSKNQLKYKISVECLCFAWQHKPHKTVWARTKIFNVSIIQRFQKVFENLHDCWILLCNFEKFFQFVVSLKLEIRSNQAIAYSPRCPREKFSFTVLTHNGRQHNSACQRVFLFWQF